MKNVKSVANKVGLIKKKYSLPLSTSSKAASGDAAPPGHVIPKITAKVIKKGAGTKEVLVKKEIMCQSGTWTEVKLDFRPGGAQPIVFCWSKVLRRLRRRSLRTKSSKKTNKRSKRRLTSC
jgi:hypothetical protein